MKYGRNVGLISYKGKSPKQGLTSAEVLTVMHHGDATLPIKISLKLLV